MYEEKMTQADYLGAVAGSCNTEVVPAATRGIMAAYDEMPVVEDLSLAASAIEEMADDLADTLSTIRFRLDGKPLAKADKLSLVRQTTGVMILLARLTDALKLEDV